MRSFLTKMVYASAVISLAFTTTLPMTALAEDGWGLSEARQRDARQRVAKDRKPRPPKPRLNNRNNVGRGSDKPIYNPAGSIGRGSDKPTYNPAGSIGRR